MISRFIGALVRAFLVIVMIVTPSLLLPGPSAEMMPVITLVALFAAVLTFFEYASTYPGLVEFRDAPPFNRIRFGSLFLTVILLSVLEAPGSVPAAFSTGVLNVAAAVGNAVDFPYSPVRLLVLMLPPDVDARHQQLVRDAAGIAYGTSICTLAIFVIFQRLRRWPTRKSGFNVWVNLPTFDPTAGGDVVERLERDARFNIALGFLLPFLMPAVIKSASSLFGTVALDNPQTLIWTVAAWAFLPASLFMRGIAMSRIALLITEKRKHASKDEGSTGLVPA